MADTHPILRGRGLGVYAMDVTVAIGFLAFGAVVMWDSHRIGAGWAFDGPQAGYVPFYVGVLICASSMITLAQAVLKRSRVADRQFVTWEQLRLVSEVLIPSLVYVAVIPWLGIYVSTVLYISWFMWRIGHYGLLRILPIALGVPVLVFLTFEIWFKISLPKGPVESWLGF
jgi:hypothetical protein